MRWRGCPVPRATVLLSTIFVALFAGSRPAAAQTIDTIEVRLSPTERVVTVGGLVAFEADVVNTGAVVLTREAMGGVALNLNIPDGFALAEGSARIVTTAGAEVEARLVDGGGVPQLRQGRDGEGVTSSLGPGQALRFRFALRATTRVKAMTTVRLEAALGAPNGTALSAPVAARIRIEADPEFDLGFVVGTVYCDSNENGRRDDGEPGLGGVRLVSDTGRAVDSDRDGRWHLRDLRAGAHLVKLDVNTLPPQARLLGSPRALVDVTPGLPKTASFAVACTFVEARPEVVVAAAPPAKPIAVETTAEGPSAWSTVRGDADGLALAIGPEQIASARITLLASGQGSTVPGPNHLNLPWSPAASGFQLSLQMQLKDDAIVSGADQPTIEGWEISVQRVEGARLVPVRVYAGRGALPGAIVWDGRGADGQMVATRGSLFELRARVARAAPRFRELLTSQPLLVGIAWKAGAAAEAPEPVFRETWTGNHFDREDRGTRKLDKAVKGLEAALKAFPDAQVVIEVDLDPSDVADVDQLRSGRQAWAVAEALRRIHGLPGSRIATTGHGSTRVGPRGRTVGEREAQKRITVTLWPASTTEELAPPPVVKHERRATVGGRPAVIGPAGDFGIMAPSGAELSVSLANADDFRRELIVTVAHDPAFEAAETSRLLEDPLSGFGGKALATTLGPGAAVAETTDRGPRTADDLTLFLPARGSELGAPRLFVHGRSHRDNIITVAGQTIRVAADGRFAELIAIPSDTTELVIESRDKAGHVARLAWPLKVSSTEFFLLALGDSSTGQAGARLTELAHYDHWKNNDLFVAGRGALYARGRVSGAVLGRELRFAVHADSTKRSGFDPFFQQIIDPARDYVVFGDGTDDLFAANSRGPLYALIEVDRSKIGWGSFQTDMRGIQLFRYERTFDGAHADIDFEAATGYRTRVKGFASDENRRLVRRYDELRATGGSLYYLSSKHVARGSERVDLVLRELDTGIEMGRARLERDRHYRIDYAAGRVMTEGPIPSVADAFFAIDGYQPFGGRAILDGHQVWVVISYEMDADQRGGDIAWGAQVQQEIAGIVEVGGGIVREGRPAGAGGSDPSYMQWGVHAKVKASENSFAAVEYAQSRAKEGVAFRSTDGGLRFDDLDRAQNADAGWGLFATLQAEIHELAGVAREDLDLQVRGHWQLLQPGFRTAGLAHEEGTEKWGGEIVWRPLEHIRAQLRYDGGTLLQDPALDDPDGTTRAIVRNRFLARYDHALTRQWSLFGELTIGQHRDDRVPNEVPTTGGAAIGLRWDVLPRLALTMSQEVLYGGDDRVLGESNWARLQTNLGAAWALDDRTSFRVIETLRWNGDNATRIGLVGRINDGARAYLEERFERGAPNARLVRSSVVGAEMEVGGADGRAYGEYRLDSGVGGHTNRAVLGLGRAFEVAPGVRTTFAYERSQALDAPGGSGRGARDVLSGGLQVTAADRLKLAAIFEARWDRDRPAEAATEAFQGVARANMDFKLSDDLTFVGFLDYGLTQDLATRAILAENLVGTLGLAWRPLEHDDFTMLFRWSRVVGREGFKSTDLFGDERRWTSREDSDLFSIGAVIELPWRLQLTEKLVWRRTGQRSGDLGLESHHDALLWINRLAFHVFDRLDLAGEFRALVNLAGLQTEQNSGLVEATWILADHARLGIGWNINGLAGGILPGEQMNDIRNGFFVRVTGMY